MSRRRKKQKLGVIGTAVLYINLMVVGLLLCSYLTPWVDPKKLWPVALLGIAYVPLLAINGVFVMGWLLTRPVYALISLAAILLGWNALSAHIGFAGYASQVPQTAQARDSSDLRVMTYNVHLFRGRDQAKNVPDIQDEAISLIEEVAPDIVCIQEFYTRKKGHHDISRSFRHRLGLNHQLIHAVAKNNFESYGMAIFSKYPIVSSGRVADFEQGVNSIVYADINKNGRLIRVYNVHLRSFGFQKEDYDFINNPTNALGANASSTKRIGSRMKNAFSIRSQQARSLRLHSEQAEIPVLVAGDFNDTPLSFAVNHVGRGLQNAFKEKGRGLGVTYNGDFPNFQIDYILASADFEVRNYEIVKRKLSDHYPVWSDITFK